LSTCLGLFIKELLVCLLFFLREKEVFVELDQIQVGILVVVLGQELLEDRIELLFLGLMLVFNEELAELSDDGE
jgi:hypothetical protein